MTTAQIAIPPKLGPVFKPERGELRYRGAYGGRGSGKSFSFALMAATFGYREPLRILCTRELQVSIKESFHAELKAAIASKPWLAAHYAVGVDYLRGLNGTEFIFRGLRHNMSSIKSMAQIDICIVEEAEDVPEQSWVDLEPTIRAPKSEIWVVWNPRTDGSPVDKRLIKDPPPRSCVVKLNYLDNPKFPKVLEEQRKHAQRTMDSGAYAHIWEGCYWSASDAQIFNKKWRVDDFETPGRVDRFYYGADWGFAQDPTTLIRSFIQNDCLFIDHEAYGIGIDIEDLPELFNKVPGADKWPIKADNSRPETISAMRRRKFNVNPARKWPGSVEDGIAYMRGFKEIIIHPRCKRTAEEFRLYSYKTDRLTGEVLPVVIDANNHCIDAIRYSLDGYIKPAYEGPSGLSIQSL
ncbi:MAG: PBSX family phage terminase large subunit [Methylomicrobium sp.]|nr:PBSX family phage terminase large subunit [Methylomicrobium sp.]